jgi:hypothetical protein
MNGKMRFITAKNQKLEKTQSVFIANQEIPDGNKLHIYSQVAQNMASQRNYENERKKLVVMLNECLPLS